MEGEREKQKRGTIFPGILGKFLFATRASVLYLCSSTLGISLALSWKETPHKKYRHWQYEIDLHALAHGPLPA